MKIKKHAIRARDKRGLNFRLDIFPKKDMNVNALKGTLSQKLILYLVVYSRI